ncbi:Transglutaminase-like_superfamily protein [Hexamita inflata]|uniref:Transglutaminase-like superfamily protein n=1 Tax=Hexamita inflata TaxID=28002 RepID=A0AA86RHZ7_9EUKA|nr:Transglutaminase-like superfamily protein [Hexamita inflata]
MKIDCQSNSHIDTTWSCAKDSTMLFFNVDDEHCFKAHTVSNMFSVPKCQSMKFNYFQMQNRRITSPTQFAEYLQNCQPGQVTLYFDGQDPTIFLGPQGQPALIQAQFARKQRVKITGISLREKVLATFTLEVGAPIKTVLDGTGEYLLKMTVDQFKVEVKKIQAKGIKFTNAGEYVDAVIM